MNGEVMGEVGDSLLWGGGEGDEGLLGLSLPSFDIFSFCYWYRENETNRVLRIWDFKLGTGSFLFCVNVGM